MLLNILGLSVAFVAFMITLIKVYSEFTFDSMHKNRERIYMVEFTYGNMNGFDNIHQRSPLERFFGSSPLIEKSLVMIPPFIKQIEFRIKNENGEPLAFLSDVSSAEPQITEIFDFQILNGSQDCLQNPQLVMIPASLAKKLYGTLDVVGKEILTVDKIWTIKDQQFMIGAVYKDFPANTQLRNDIYISMDPQYAMDGTEGRSCFGYVMLTSPEAATELSENFNPAIIGDKSYMKDVSLKLIPLEDIYSHYDQSLVTKGGNYVTLYILISIGLLVLIIAIINHMNLNASLAPIRIRSINTQKVLGCTNRRMRFFLITESVFICIFAFLVSVLFMTCVNSTQLFAFIGVDLSIAKNLSMMLITLLIAVILGIVSGISPAYYMTSFSPALVLKGSFGLSPKGKVVRNFLVGFQLIITVALISASIYLYLQNSFMKNSEKGFDQDKVVMVTGNVSMMRAYKYDIAEKLKLSPLISDVAFASDKFGAADVYNWNEATTPKDEKIPFNSIFTSYNFFDVMGITVTEGEKPTINDQKSAKGVYVFNQLTKDQHQLEILDELMGYRSYTSPVKAFTNNVTLTSKRIKECEIGYFVQDDFVNIYANYMFVRMADHVNPIEVSNLIQNTFKEYDPTAIINIEFYDTMIRQLYKKEENMEKLISGLTLLTILLSVIGLFGLVLFETEYKRKEIGVRKVFGATTGEILYSLNMTYLRMVLICTLISIPLTYLGVQTWLETFAYRIPVYWWVFALSATIVLIITLLTVSSQSWKAARENPVNSVKSL